MKKNVFHFTQEEIKQIENAVADLEKMSSGEVVPYFVYSSDNYFESSWKSSVFLGVLATFLIGGMAYMWLLPDWITPLEICIFILASMFFGFIIPVLSLRVRILISDDNYINNRVMQRAETAFLEEGVYKTIDKTGILIFISFKEHKVIVMGDEGINKKVKTKQWDKIVNTIIHGIKNKKTAEGIIEAIGLCSKLLLDNGFVVKEGDTNEISNHFRL